MKEQNYKKHIGLGVKLDKLQEGDFNYDNKHEESGTLSEFAKTVRDDICKGNDKHKPETVSFDVSCENITLQEYFNSNAFISYYRVEYDGVELEKFDNYEEAKSYAVEHQKYAKEGKFHTIIAVRHLDTIIDIIR